MFVPPVEFEGDAAVRRSHDHGPRDVEGGETQPTSQRWNPPGYMRNVVEATRVTAA